MEENLQRRFSRREIKIRRDSAYEYDEKVLNSLTNKSDSGASNWQQCTISDSCPSPVNNNISAKTILNSGVLKANSWSDLIFNFDSINNSENSTNKLNTNNSQSESTPRQIAASGVACSSVNQNIGSINRRNSSTDLYQPRSPTQCTDNTKLGPRGSREIYLQGPI